MKAPIITRADLPAFRELILNYQQWRRANNLEPSTFWEEKLRAALEAEGLIKPKQERTPVTTSEAAAILDVTDEQVARLCRDGELKARKVFRAWRADTRWEVNGVSVRKRRTRLAKRFSGKPAVSKRKS